MDLIVYAAIIVAASIFLGSVIRAYSEPVAPAGRYQLQAGPDDSCWVLDTRRGRLWKKPAGTSEWSEEVVPWVRRPRGRFRPRS